MLSPEHMVCASGFLITDWVDYIDFAEGRGGNRGLGGFKDFAEVVFFLKLYVYILT
jgi:hypothetical protein